MYDRRIKIFIIFSTALLLVCLGRLVHMQLLSGSFYLEKIDELKRRGNLSKQLKTIRGKILDRNGKVLAADEPLFQICISYELSSFADSRIKPAKLLAAAKKSLGALDKKTNEINERCEDLQQIIEKCAQLGIEQAEIEKKIKKINDSVWNLRSFIAWRRKHLNPEILKEYNNQINKIPMSVALADFRRAEPNEIDRIKITAKIDVPQMHRSWPLFDLETDDDVFTAQMLFLGIDGIEIKPKAMRVYPFDSVAAQTVGWVGIEQKKKLFANDRLSSYLEREVSGRRPGVEYACEAILRGRRGEVVYNIDSELIEKTNTRFGKDVSVTLDADLQKQIEEYLTSYDHNPECKPGMSAVVLDVVTGDILAMVSLPTFNLNRIRYDWNKINNDPNRPMTNRAIYALYPPGSVIKPIILIAGLESKKISSGETKSCPDQKAPKGWPSCWTLKHWYGHDDKWPNNNARNAIKGSCNIYFSRLANRIKSSVLQQWLFNFGYGRHIPLTADILRLTEHKRSLLQAQGAISSQKPALRVTDFNDLPTLNRSEKRMFGIGQGNMRVTPLQVANAMATIARGGLYKSPNLFIEKNEQRFVTTSLNISKQTLDIVRDGMKAVVNENDGTANDAFAGSDFSQADVIVYGKTGSTQAPENAWFAGFAEDDASRCISIAVLIEGGQSGAKDAAPLARDIIKFCIDAGYIGKE